MTTDRAEWSEPTIVQVSADEPTGAVPELPAESPEPAPEEAEPEPEPAPEAAAEPEPGPEAEPEPEPEAQPEFTSTPVTWTPLTRRPRVDYATGTLPSWRASLLERTADAAVVAMPIPLRVLDVGCGDGLLLTELILRIPYAELYLGIDPRADAVPAVLRAQEPRLSVVQAAAEALPVPDASFDLVLASLSLTLWLDQIAGAAELARVVSDNGKVVVVETKAPQLSGRKRVHGVKDIRRLLESVGLAVERVETLHRSPVGVSLAHAFIASP